MAPQQLSPCCIATNTHQGEPVGTIHESIYGLPTYVSGDKSSGKLLIIAADIYGYSYINNKLIADAFAAKGYYVLLPDLLKNDFAIPGKPELLPAWLQKHPVSDVSKMYIDFVQKAKEDLKPSFTAGTGYCFGAKFVVENLTKDGLLEAGAVAHPSFVTPEDVDAIAKPILISAAQDDVMFPAVARHKAEEILIKNQQRFQIDLFSGVSHGFAVRGDLKNPVVKYAYDKALSDQLVFFGQFSK
ncbi:protein [Saccharomycopsis crataegensis]|uniref:Protein n=1 Tax=Saccharomycopsis crataegensis TaxID=43959 RepID=A0AAV5QP47_9ASCO|nr:protein [Saccharomycopsis crataegensis]